MSEDRRPSIYGASKLADADAWHVLRENRSDIRWTARWPDIEGCVPDTEENATMFWLHDIADVTKSDFVMVLPPKQGVLRGALIEAGAALALGRTVLLVGDCPCYGTWRHHPLVFQFPTIDAACNFAVGDFTKYEDAA